MSWKSRIMSRPASAQVGWHIHKGMLAINERLGGTPATTILRIPAWATADYIGTFQLIKIGQSIPAQSPIGYVRLK